MPPKFDLHAKLPLNMGMNARLISVAGLLLAFLFVADARGQWTLTTADFHTQAVALKSIDSAGVHVAPAAGGPEAVVPFDEFLDISRPQAATQSGGKFVLHLLGDDQLTGEPLSIQGNDLLWNSPELGEISLPMKGLIAITRPGATPPENRGREDVITLANGDTLHGILGGFSEGKTTMQTDAGNSDVPIVSVNEIDFAASSAKVSAAPGFHVRFDDGSSAVASAVKVEGDKAELSFGKGAAHTVDLNRIVAIEQVNGPVSWLTSRPLTENVYIPLIGAPRSGAAKMNRTWEGFEPIRFGSQAYAHGIGTHSYSRLSWALDGKYAAFRTRYAIDTKDANAKADVTVRILLDGKVAYEQPHVRAGALSPIVALDLGSAKQLTLEVDYGDNLDTQDRFNWIEPALLKHTSDSQVR